MITDLPDIDNIQLLRGPQGTLFGKNVVSGAIDVKTREPSFERETSAEITYGNYNQARASFAYDTPLGDKVAVRASYLFSGRDGIIDNTKFKKDWDDQINNAARLDLLYKPSDAFKLRLIGDYSMQQGEMGFQSVAAVLPTTLDNGSQVRRILSPCGRCRLRPYCDRSFLATRRHRLHAI